MTAMRAFLLLTGILSLANLTSAQPEKQRKPKFTIGKETTVIDGPIDKDGYVDYATALNLRLSKGIAPDKNMVAMLAKVFGPKHDGNKVPAEFYQWLSIPAPPENGENFLSLSQY